MIPGFTSYRAPGINAINWNNLDCSKIITKHWSRFFLKSRKSYRYVYLVGQSTCPNVLSLLCFKSIRHLVWLILSSEENNYLFFKKLGLLSPWWLTHHSLCFLASSWRSSTAALWDHHALDAKSCALAEWRQFEWGNTQIKSMKKVKVPVNVFAGKRSVNSGLKRTGSKNEIVRAKMWCLRLFKEWGLKRNPVRPCIGVVRWSKVRKTFFFLSLTVLGNNVWFLCRPKLISKHKSKSRLSWHKSRWGPRNFAKNRSTFRGGK